MNRRIYKRVKMISMIILSFCVLLLTACSKPVDRFKNAVKDGDYEKAIEVYENYINGDTGKEEVANLFMNEYLSQALEDYASGKGSASVYQKAFKTIDRIEHGVGIKTGADKTDERFTKIKNSKSQYKKGKKLLSSGEWLKAMKAFAAVVSDDTENYKASRKKVDDAEKKYVDGIIEKADTFVKDGDYENAIVVVSEAVHNLPHRYSKSSSGDVTETTYQGLSDEGKKLLEYLSAKTETWIEAEYKAKEYKTVFNIYQGAVDNEDIEVSDKMNDTYNASITEYLKDVDSRAESAFGESKDYEAAMQVYKDELADTEELDIDEIRSHLEDNKESYRAYIPIYLTTLEYTQKSDYVLIGDNNWDYKRFEDVNGKSYDAESVIMPWGTPNFQPKSEDEANVIYNLNYNYSTLTGVIYRPYCSLSSKTEWKGSTTVKIYGDDQLLYEAPNITKETYETYDFSVDVSGVRNLKIVIKGLWGEYDDEFGLSDGYPRVCMGEVKLQK